MVSFDYESDFLTLVNEIMKEEDYSELTNNSNVYGFQLQELCSSNLGYIFEYCMPKCIKHSKYDKLLKVKLLGKFYIKILQKFLMRVYFLIPALFDNI